MNGDTYADVDLGDLLRRLGTLGTDLAIAITHLDDVAQYGAIGIDEKSEILTGFGEKQGSAGAYVNAGGLLPPARYFRHLCRCRQTFLRT